MLQQRDGGKKSLKTNRRASWNEIPIYRDPVLLHILQKRQTFAILSQREQIHFGLNHAFGFAGVRPCPPAL